MAEVRAACVRREGERQRDAGREGDRGRDGPRGTYAPSVEAGPLGAHMGAEALRFRVEGRVKEGGETTKRATAGLWPARSPGHGTGTANSGCGHPTRLALWPCGPGAAGGAVAMLDVCCGTAAPRPRAVYDTSAPPEVLTQAAAPSAAPSKVSFQIATCSLRTDLPSAGLRTSCLCLRTPGLQTFRLRALLDSGLPGIFVHGPSSHSDSPPCLPQRRPWAGGAGATALAC